MMARNAKWGWFCLLLLSAAGCSSCFDRAKPPSESARPAASPAPSPSTTAAATESAPHVRQAILAGSWYPAEKDKLSAYIDELLFKADRVQTSGKIMALIAPHAGYMFSGKAAATGYQQIKGQDIRRVIILGVPHHLPFHGAAIDESSHFETPLGRVPLDQTALAHLRQCAVVQTLPEAFQREHSVEIQLPLLQRVLPSFSLVPILLGEMTDKDYVVLGRAISQILDSHTLVVASSDFTHRGPNYHYELPQGKGTIQERLDKLDQGSVDRILKLNRSAFLTYVNQTGTTICGAHAIALLLELFTHAKPVQEQVLSHYSSGEITGDWINTVSYFDIAFMGEWPSRSGLDQARNAGAQIFPLSSSDKQFLLRLARTSLEAAVRKKSFDPSITKNLPPLTSLLRKAGAFVTLKCKQRPGAICIGRGEELRGCIGTILPLTSVYETVAQRAASAALDDTRFPSQVGPDELKHITIEVSVLTPPRTVRRAEEIIIGQHGIILTKDGRSATFLPQVAPEQGWNRDTTLTHLALKAGLDASDWQNGAQFSVYEAIVFSETP